MEHRTQLDIKINISIYHGRKCSKMLRLKTNSDQKFNQKPHGRYMTLS